MEPLLERVRAVVASVFQLPPEQVGPESSPRTIEAWDSMGHLTLVLELEQEFGVQLPPEDVERMSDVTAIVALLAPKLGAVAG